MCFAIQSYDDEGVMPMWSTPFRHGVSPLTQILIFFSEGSPSTWYSGWQNLWEAYWLLVNEVITVQILPKEIPLDAQCP